MSTFESSLVRAQIRAICRAAESVQPGQFIFIKAYKSENGEISDYWLHYGRDYGKMKERFVEQLRKALWGGLPLEIKVDYKTFIDPKTNKEYPRNKDGSGRIESDIVLDNLSETDPDVRKVLVNMLQSYNKQSAKTNVRSKKATGIYINEKNKSLCIRMCSLASKREVEKAPNPSHEYSTKPAAIRKAIKDRFLRLREFKLDRFESISIGGNILPPVLNVSEKERVNSETR